MPLEENIRLFKKADAAGDTSRKITWVCVAPKHRHWLLLTLSRGTGVGLVKDIRPAGEIVKQAREDALKTIKRLHSAI